MNIGVGKGRAVVIDRLLILMILMSTVYVAWMGWTRLRTAVQRSVMGYERNEDLWQAAGKGNSASVKRLLAQGADPDYSADGTFTILMEAWDSKDKPTIDAVLKAHPDLDGPLRYAVKTNDVAFVRFLLDHGGDKNTCDYDGRSLLSLARLHNSTEVVAILKKAHAVDIGPSQTESNS